MIKFILNKKEKIKLKLMEICSQFGYDSVHTFGGEQLNKAKQELILQSIVDINEIQETVQNHITDLILMRTEYENKLIEIRKASDAGDIQVMSKERLIGRSGEVFGVIERLTKLIKEAENGKI